MFHQAVTTISVRNLEASLAFYTGVLGFRVVHRLEPEIVHLAGPGIMLALRPIGNASSAESPAIHIGLFVTDLDEARRSLEEKGVAFLGEPVDARIAKVAFFNDPDGNSFYLCQWMQWREAA